MEELHKIHKDVPYGYWVFWIEPLIRRMAARRRPAASSCCPAGAQAR
ncbi:hypothetical protein [Phenylobacterium zucineum]|nr:hypothetical protein [Phenylobacterium zucineum]